MSHQRIEIEDPLPAPPTHPARVAQPKRAVAAPAARPPHPATVVQPKRAVAASAARPPHPATVVQPKRAGAGTVAPPPHPAAVVQQSRARVDMSWLGTGATIEIKEGKKTVKYKGTYVNKSKGTPGYFDFRHNTSWPINLNINKSGPYLTVTLDTGKSLSLRPYPDNVASIYQFINRSGSNFLRLTFHPDD